MRAQSSCLRFATSYLYNRKIIKFLFVKKYSLNYLFLFFGNPRLQVLKLASWDHRRQSYLCGKNTVSLLCQTYGHRRSAMRLACESWSGNGYEEGFGFLCVLLFWMICWRQMLRCEFIGGLCKRVTKMEWSWPVKENLSYFVHQIVQIILPFSFKNFFQVFKKSCLIVLAIFWKLRGRSNFIKSCRWEERHLAQTGVVRAVGAISWV